MRLPLFVSQPHSQAAIISGMGTIHIAEADLAQNLTNLLAEVRAGNEVVIESDATVVAVLKSPEFRGRPIEESIAILRAHEKERGYPVVMDADFAADMEEIIRNRRPSRYVRVDE